MGFVNKVMLLGNTTRDPELRTLSSGTVVCEFGLATNRHYKTAAGEEKQETAFIDCTAFGRIAEIIAEHTQKGRQLFVEGRLHFESWEDKNNNKRSKLSVIVENFQFVGSRESNNDPAPPRDVPQNPAEKLSQKRLEPRSQKSPQARANERFQAGRRPDQEPAQPQRSNLRAKSKTHDAKSVDQMADEIETLEDAELPF